MERIKIAGYEVEEAVEVRVNFNDAEMEARKWQIAYFKLLAYKNTWGHCYKLDMVALHDNSACIELVVYASEKEQYIALMKDLYPEDAVKVYNRRVVAMEMEYNEDIDDYFIEW